MTPSNRTIFRSGAVEAYMQAKAQTVLPRFIAPPAPLCLWLLLGCLFAVSTLAWLAHVPVYRNGTATVKDAELIVAFFPPESQSEMRTGQKLSFKLDPAGPPLLRTIESIEPTILSPAQARRRFNLDNASAGVYKSPAAIAIARLGQPSETLPASAYDGVVVEAQVEIGSQRLITLLPVVGNFFKQ
ncbi:MAG TPA: hypothetical protein VFR78_19235 [Pyrinomonadaceae bacterium]|nr:hypothetical protein [Pyrinomonadaceae bacterium]